MSSFVPTNLYETQFKHIGNLQQFETLFGQEQPTNRNVNIDEDDDLHDVDLYAPSASYTQHPPKELPKLSNEMTSMVDSTDDLPLPVEFQIGTPETGFSMVCWLCRGLAPCECYQRDIIYQVPAINDPIDRFHMSDDSGRQNPTQISVDCSICADHFGEDLIELIPRKICVSCGHFIYEDIYGTLFCGHCDLPPGADVNDQCLVCTHELGFLMKPGAQPTIEHWPGYLMKCNGTSCHRPNCDILICSRCDVHQHNQHRHLWKKLTDLRDLVAPKSSLWMYANGRPAKFGCSTCSSKKAHYYLIAGGGDRFVGHLCRDCQCKTGEQANETKGAKLF